MKDGNLKQCKKTLHGLKGTVASLFIQYGLEDIICLEEDFDNIPTQEIFERIHTIQEKLNVVTEYISKTYTNN